MTMDLLTAATGWADATVLEGVDPSPTAVVCHEAVTTADLPGLFDIAYSQVAAAVTAAGNPPIGPALAIYRGDPTGTFSVEIGFPVAAPFPGAGGVVGSELPGGRIAALTHRGPYDSLPASWARLMEFVAQRGLHPGPRHGEIYLTEPTPATDPATLRTDIFVELA